MPPAHLSDPLPCHLWMKVWAGHRSRPRTSARLLALNRAHPRAPSWVSELVGPIQADAGTTRPGALTLGAESMSGGKDFFPLAACRVWPVALGRWKQHLARPPLCFGDPAHISSSSCNMEQKGPNPPAALPWRAALSATGVQNEDIWTGDSRTPGVCSIRGGGKLDGWC